MENVIEETGLDVSKLEVDHIDGNKSNNHESNLRWCTRAEIIRGSYAARTISLENKKRKVRENNGYKTEY